MTAMAGNYVNFGVFELYGDRALDDALDIALKMILSIPAAHILSYRKVCHILIFIANLPSYHPEDFPTALLPLHFLSFLFPPFFFLLHFAT